MVFNSGMRKPLTDRAVTKSFSLPFGLLDSAIKRQRKYQLGSFSDYVQMLIRQDAIDVEKEKQEAA
jgi:hypothetical protein